MTSESTRFLGQPNEIKPTEGAVGAVGLVTSTIVPPPAVGQRLAGGSHGVLLWKPLESHPFHDETVQWMGHRALGDCGLEALVFGLKEL